jgi:hypothetical protein
VLVTARVNFAGADRVVLFAIQRHTKPQRELPLYRDETYEVRWAPEGGYTYYRLRDNVRMSSYTWPTPESAKAALIDNEYAKTMSSGVVG